MRLRTHLLIAACLLCVATGSIAADSTVSQDMYTQNGFDGRILDASTPTPERLKLFSHIVNLANAGQVQAQDVAGTMYWQGSKLEGSPVPQDLKDARALLANAAIRGDLLAMAKMSELELQSGDKDASMVWAQLFAHYLNPLGQRAHQNAHNTAYAADLMQRIVKAGGVINDQTSAHVNAFVKRYDTQIRDGLEAMRYAREHNETHIISGPQVNLTGSDTNLTGVADYMVAFDASGKPVHIWTIASYPNADVAKATRQGMDVVRVNPTSANAGLRYLHMPIPLNGGHKTVRIAH